MEYCSVDPKHNDDKKEDEKDPRTKGMSAIVVIGNRTHRVSGPVVKQLLYELEHQSQDEKLKNSENAAKDADQTQLNLRRLYAANEVAEINKLLGKPLTDAKALGLIKNLLLDKVHSHLAKTMDLSQLDVGSRLMQGNNHQDNGSHNGVQNSLNNGNSLESGSQSATDSSGNPASARHSKEGAGENDDFHTAADRKHSTHVDGTCRDLDPKDKCQYLKDLGLCSEGEKHPEVRRRCQETCGLCECVDCTIQTVNSPPADSPSPIPPPPPVAPPPPPPPPPPPLPRYQLQQLLGNPSPAPTPPGQLLHSSHQQKVEKCEECEPVECKEPPCEPNPCKEKTCEPDPCKEKTCEPNPCKEKTCDPTSCKDKPCDPTTCKEKPCEPVECKEKPCDPISCKEKDCDPIPCKEKDCEPVPCKEKPCEQSPCKEKSCANRHHRHPPTALPVVTTPIPASSTPSACAPSLLDASLRPAVCSPTQQATQESILDPDSTIHPLLTNFPLSPTVPLRSAPTTLTKFRPTYLPHMHRMRPTVLHPDAMDTQESPGVTSPVISPYGVCMLPVEIGIAIDTSAAMIPHWQQMLYFVKSLVDKFQMFGVSRIGVITFDTIAKIPIHLEKYKDPEALKANLDKLYADPYGRRRTDAALEMAKSSFFEKGRPGVPKVLFIVEHGRINGGDPSINWEDLLLDPAQKLREMGVNIFAVGATPIVTPEELKILTGDWSHVVPLQTYSQLLGIVPQLALKACKLAGIVRRSKYPSAND